MSLLHSVIIFKFLILMKQNQVPVEPNNESAKKKCNFSSPVISLMAEVGTHGMQFPKTKIVHRWVPILLSTIELLQLLVVLRQSNEKNLHRRDNIMLKKMPMAMLSPQPMLFEPKQKY